MTGEGRVYSAGEPPTPEDMARANPAIPDRVNPPSEERARSFWLGGHKAGKTTTQRGEVDVAVALGKHVHTFGEEGARCYNGDCDLTMPTISRSTAPLDLDNLPVSAPARGSSPER